MSGEELIVIPGEPPRAAVVMRESPLEVRWEDTGETESLPSWPKGSRRVIRGTLAHRRYTDPHGVEEALSDPEAAAEVVVALLHDLDMPLSVNDIKRRLTDPKGSYAIRRELITKGVRGLPKRLAAHPHIAVSETTQTVRGKTSTVPHFRWVAAATEEDHSDLDDHSPLAEQHVAEGASAGPTELTVDARPDPDEQVVAAEGPEVPAGSGEPDPLGFLVGGDLPDHLDFASMAPSEVVGRLGELSDKQLAAARSRFEDEGRYDLAVALLATPRDAKPVRALLRDWPDDPASSAALERGLVWLLPTEGATRVIGILAQRPVAPTEGIVTFAVAALTRTRPDARPALLRILAAAAPPAVVRALDGANIPGVLRVVNREPLPSRSRLLWAAMRATPSAIVSPDAWGREVTVDDLAVVAGRTPDDALLEDQWVRDQIVSPRVDAAVRDVGTRVELAAVLAWPRTLLRDLAPEVLAAAVRRVAGRDPALAELVGELAGRSEADSLRTRLAEADAAVARAREELVSARESEQAALAAEQRSFQRSAAAEREQVAAGQGELRQAQLDGTKALVEVLALGARLDPSLTLADALDRMRDRANQLGVSAIGSPGTQERYDPTRHELLGEERAEVVEVREPGYAYGPSGGGTVLRRAAVVAIDSDTGAEAPLDTSAG